MMPIGPDARVRLSLISNAHTASLGFGACWTIPRCWHRAEEALGWLRDQRLHPHVWTAACDQDWFNTPAAQLSNLWIAQAVKWIQALAADEGQGGSVWRYGWATALELHAGLQQAPRRAYEIYVRVMTGETYEQISADPVLDVTPEEARGLFDQVVSLGAQMHHGSAQVIPHFVVSNPAVSDKPSPPPGELLEGLYRSWEHEIRERLRCGENAGKVAADLRLALDGIADDELLIKSLWKLFYP